MKAGLDFGTTLVKAAWRPQDKFEYLTSKRQEPKDLLVYLKNQGVTHISITGINHRKYSSLLTDFSIESLPSPKELIEKEIELQVQGTRYLIHEQNLNLENFLLVSVGSGTSYTHVTKDDHHKELFGNPLGGGFIRGNLSILDMINYEPTTLSHQPISLDITMKDIIPELEKTLEGELVIASMGKATQYSTPLDIYAAITNTVATAIIRDILKMSFLLESANHNVIDTIIYLGTTITTTPTLRIQLEKYTNMVGKTCHFLKNGEYAGAIGAYLYNV